MKKLCAVLLVSAMLMLTACNSTPDNNHKRRHHKKDHSRETRIEETVETTEDLVDDSTEDSIIASNSAVIGLALDREPTERCVNSVASGLYTAGAGYIQDAELGVNEYGDPELYVVGEDGTNYRVMLTNGYSLVAIENVDTGEWPVWSEM